MAHAQRTAHPGATPATISGASSGDASEHLREILHEASEPIAQYWPMRRFIYRNPLQGLEHLPFDEAIARARLLLGGQGYLANEEYRSFVRQGRMTKEGVAEALRRVGPYMGAKATIRIGAKAIRPEEVVLVHVLHGIEPLDPVLLNWHLDHELATTRFRSDVPPDTRQRILASLGQTSPSHARNGSPDPEAIYLEKLWSTILTAFAPPELPSSTLADAPLHEPCESEARASHDDPPLGPTQHQTVGEWLGQLTGVDLVERINDQVIKWCAPFVDEGLASWSMPSRERGLYQTWRDLAGRDRSWRFWGVPGAARQLRALPEQPDEAVVAILRRLGVSQERWTDYLSRHLAQLPGWAGFLRWRSDNPAYHQHRVAPLHLLEYVAIRLFYEAELVAATATRLWQVEGTLPALVAYVEGHPELRRASAALVSREASGLHPGRQAASETLALCRDAWRLFHLAQFLELMPQDLAQAAHKDLRALLEVLDAYPSDQHGPVWLEAYEDRYRRNLLAKLARSGGPQENRAGRPKTQAVFCIDARSESFRRHLEAQGPYETFGFAGFFGVPICYCGFDSEETLALCPVLLTPKHAVQEVPRPDQAEPLRLGLAGSRWRAFGRHLLHDLKSHPIASYVVYDLIGFLFALGLVGKTLARRPYQRWLNGIRQRLMAPVATQMMVGSRNGSETPGAPAPDSGDGPAPEIAQGFEIAEQATFVEGGLRVMGLTRNFARLVLLCGHGSTTDNNPYASALDCGACGGSHGDPNARTFAAMGNNPEVRRTLKARGLDIPEDTWFLAGKHDTTTDRVTFYDLEDLPASHRDDVRNLAEALRGAGHTQALERCHRLPGAPRQVSPAAAFRHVEGRSVDWSQVRPEWGLSGNAAFLIGRRTRTKGIDLGGRVFLHSYDPEQDPSGTFLEKIMTAPLIVGEWINMEYYFSAVDPWFFGSGTKTLHNVVGGVGVMLGRHSDLQTGLPLETVNDGANHYHEPMRLLAIIEAKPEIIAEIIKRHTVLQQLFDNQWVNLVAWDPSSSTFRRYQPGGKWEPLVPEGQNAA